MSGTRNPNQITKVIELRPGMENASVIVRVLESHGIRTIRTRSGTRTIGEYVVGDETGRVKLIAWGTKASALAIGDVAEIRGAWVSMFRGEVQLNIGKNSIIERLPDDAVVSIDEVPKSKPRIERQPHEYSRRPPRRSKTVKRKR